MSLGDEVVNCARRAADVQEANLAVAARALSRWDPLPDDFRATHAAKTRPPRF